MMRILLGRDEMPANRLSVRLLWEPRDIWIGAFWNVVRAGGPADRFLMVYLTLVPCVPVAVSWRLGAPSHGR